MRLTRSSVILGSLLCLPLVACGGDDGGGGPITTPDAKVFMDAPADMASACALPANIEGGTLGSDTMRKSDDWITKTQNVTTFSIALTLDEEGKNLVQLTVTKPGATWPTNTALNFETTPSNMPSVAAIIGLNVVNNVPEKLLWASSGSITFSEIGQAAGDKITFSTTDTSFREITNMGADVPGGCTTTVGALTVYLSQKTAVQLTAPVGPESGLWRHAAQYPFVK